MEGARAQQRVRVAEAGGGVAPGTRRKPRWNNMFLENTQHPPWSPTAARGPSRNAWDGAEDGAGPASARGPKLKPKAPLAWHTQGWNLRPVLKCVRQQAGYPWTHSAHARVRLVPPAGRVGSS